ncbi:Suppressor of Sensor Kinase (SLN1) [Coemansia sp. RSA 1722]|nr:Suppressor of Sensor Kinase (SLN1) [Coemansia sp. RSA 1722]
MRVLEESPVSFDQRLFYLYGYPQQPDKEAGQQEIHASDAHGEELRRRLQAKHTLSLALENAGARVTSSHQDDVVADYIVIPDSSSPEQREKALALGLPVINESVLFEQIKQPLTRRPSRKASKRSASIKKVGGRLRNSISLDEMIIYEPHRVESFGVGISNDDAVVIARPARSSRSSSSSSSSELEDTQFLGDLDDYEYRERQEWRDMLNAALTGEVVGSEKKRMKEDTPAAIIDGDHSSQPGDRHQDIKYKSLLHSKHLDLWLGCRAAIRGRTPLQENQTLESLRAVHADTTLRAVMEFCVDRTAFINESEADVDFSTLCLVQLQKLLRRVDYVEGMYPTLEALGSAKPVYASAAFQEKLAAITSWTNISVRLELLYKMLQRWTGSDDLNLHSTATPGDYMSTTAGISRGEVQTPPSATQRVYQHTPFVERLLKENGMRKIFEQRILTELEQVMVSARADLIENGAQLTGIGLPMSNRQMQEVLRFPPRLLQTCLQIRLQTAQNLRNLALPQIDQLIEDIRDSLSVACRVKRTFATVTRPMSYWNPEVRLDDEYDHTLRRCLKMYFSLLNRKLKLISDDGNHKDFETLETQWPFMLEVVRDIDGGTYEMALRFCQQTKNHLRGWIRVLARLLKGPPAFDTLGSRDLAKWTSRVLQTIRAPILKGQRLVRTIQDAVVNSTDYVFTNAHSLLAQLVDTKHVLVYTAGEWETRGLYILGSPDLSKRPHLARSLLVDCIVDQDLADDEDANYYLLVVCTNAEFSWTGATVMLEGGIAVQELSMLPGQMRLISPGAVRLAAHRSLLEKLYVAEKMAPGDTGTAVTDAIIEKHSRRRERVRSKYGYSESGSLQVRERRNSIQETSIDNEAQVDNDYDDYGRDDEDEDDDVFDETSSDFVALRPILDPTDRRLRRSATAVHGETISLGADGITGIRGPYARVYELARAHNPLVQKEWTLLKHGIVRMLDALTQIPDMIRMLHLMVHERSVEDDVRKDGACPGASCDLIEQVQESFSFASNTASRGARFLDLMAERSVRAAITRMCVGWCGFIAEDCQANEQRTFRWAVQALEVTMRLSRHSSTLQVLPRADWQELKSHVAGCLTLMISHFDVLGARTAATKRKQRQKQAPELQISDPNVLLSLDGISANFRTHLMQRQRLQHAQQADELRDRYLASDHRIGRVLEVTARPEDRTLRLLAASSSNITLRWQIGHYIGGGAFGAVYVGYNIDSGEMMAVKEIRLPSRGLNQDSAADSGAKIVREMEVMSMLQHPNIVTYYGIEVHRDKVYLFMELCGRGSLAQLIRDQGQLDEESVKEYVIQMLRGLEYLHGAGICHRDIKCDNTLFDDDMRVKLVDFGAAKVLNKHSLAATRRSRIAPEGAAAVASLTGTPMYMAPEVILGSNGGSVAGGPKGAEMLRPGSLGAQDIWSLGCCIVEMVSGSPPWAHLDNEWAVMYNVVAGNPPLPDPSSISPEGMRFLRRCFIRQPADRPQASDLLKDEWLASTVSMLERRESALRRTGKRRVAGHDNNSDKDSEDGGDASQEGQQETKNVDKGDLSTNATFVNNAAAAAQSLTSLSSTGSQSNLLSRSRTSSINRKNLSGDLRFTNTSGGPDAELMLSMMQNTGESGSGSGILAPAGDRSPGIAGIRSAITHVHSAHNTGTLSPLARTPGSPHSTSSTHGAAAAAWPFNKETSGTGMSTAPATIPATATDGGTEYANLHPSVTTKMDCGTKLTPTINISGSNNSSNSGGALALFSESLATSEELAAIYSHPSVVYQTLNDSSTDMGSPVGPGGVAQFAVPSTEKSITSPPDGLLTASSSLSSAPLLSNDEIQDLSETTRKALSAMLNLPLEGADVSGVSGWLGEGNTPMGMLEAEEVKETVVTTSQLVMRQREQQLRHQQELRHALRKKHFKNVIMRQKAFASSSDTQLVQSTHDSRAAMENNMGPLSDSEVVAKQTMQSLGVSETADTSEIADIDELESQQQVEPPALYPLPPSDEEVQ